MKYISTRDNIDAVSAIEAIKLGMVPQGGLFIPERIPAISQKQLHSWINLSYAQLAQHIFQLFLTNYFSETETAQIVQKAYHRNNFETEEIAPVIQLDDELFILELFHGPTGAFKDIALQALPWILSSIMKKISISNQLLILVATSGDTGKAALEGFKNIPGIQIVVYYPFEKVSKIQELQMLTTEGDNTHVIALEGNFDDCQNAVKQIFAAQDFNTLLKKEGFEFSSANSINWGRLFPQIVYYFSTYLTLLRNKYIHDKEKINFVVPTGNFGNILAAWYAREMGLPVEKLICASNINNVLTDFFNTGVYDVNRPFFSTISPSMDILVSSNLERFLFEISGRDGKLIVKLMKELQDKGRFVLQESMKNKMSDIIFAGYADEAETLNTIKSIYKEYNYLVDPHTAVGLKVFDDYRNFTKTKTIIAATATPFKFSKAVLSALLGENSVNNKEEFVLLQELSEYAKLPIPKMLQDLDKKTTKKLSLYPKDKAKQALLELLRI
jgi:threonine synthase